MRRPRPFAFEQRLVFLRLCVHKSSFISRPSPCGSTGRRKTRAPLHARTLCLARAGVASSRAKRCPQPLRPARSAADDPAGFREANGPAEFRVLLPAEHLLPSGLQGAKAHVGEAMNRLQVCLSRSAKGLSISLLVFSMPMLSFLRLVLARDIMACGLGRAIPKERRGAHCWGFARSCWWCIRSPLAIRRRMR